MRSIGRDDVINGVSAIAIRTRHLDRLLHFYCETLDFRLAAVLGGCDATGARQREVVLACGDVYVQLIEVAATEADAGSFPISSGPAGLDLIYLDVADLDATVELLRAGGLWAEHFRAPAVPPES